jgi:hypothetical protein
MIEGERRYCGGAADDTDFVINTVERINEPDRESFLNDRSGREYGRRPRLYTLDWSAALFHRLFVL